MTYLATGLARPGKWFNWTLSCTHKFNRAETLSYHQPGLIVRIKQGFFYQIQYSHLSIKEGLEDIQCLHQTFWLGSSLKFLSIYLIIFVLSAPNIPRVYPRICKEHSLPAEFLGMLEYQVTMDGWHQRKLSPRKSLGKSLRTQIPLAFFTRVIIGDMDK